MECAHPTWYVAFTQPHTTILFSHVLGLPHRVMEDDFYDGRFIPKGSIVFANIWAMSRDPNIFPEPDRFNPERFLEKVDDETARWRDPRVFVFGFGRRRCPGNHLVESSIWLMLVAILAMLDIEKPRDSDGKEIEPDVKFENSVFRSGSLLSGQKSALIEDI
jgi:cytochrome P450